MGITPPSLPQIGRGVRLKSPAKTIVKTTQVITPYHLPNLRYAKGLRHVVLFARLIGVPLPTYASRLRGEKTRTT